MFTGIIEQMAVVETLDIPDQQKNPQAKPKLWVVPKHLPKDLKLGESIAINGCCLTVARINKQRVGFDLSTETLTKTCFHQLKIKDEVHWERALQLSDRMGGHVVLGHVDTTGTLDKVEQLASQTILRFSYPPKFAKYLIEKGSITINGVSLTVSLFDPNKFEVYLIPHTLKLTHFSKLKAGDRVHLEFDMLGKYALRLLELRQS